MSWLKIVTMWTSFKRRLEDFLWDPAAVLERFVCLIRGHRWCQITFEKGHDVYVCVYCLKKDLVPSDGRSEREDDDRV